MIQTNTLKAAGIASQDIQQLSAAWEAFQAARSQTVRQTPHIVCTGIYNAGKSTLLNALAGKEIFPTGDIPTTKEIAQAEFGGAVYIDTPGLNAMEEDDRETQAAYETADFILFVASAQDGGISAAEAEWLQKLKARYGSLQQRLVYVLTHCTQVDQEQLSMIRDKVHDDFVKAVGFRLETIFCVDSITYQRGKNGDKPALVERSGISALQVCLAERIAGAEKTLREAQAAELAARQKDVLECIKRVKSFVQAEVGKTGRANGEKITAVDRAWQEFESALNAAMPEAEISPLSCWLNGYDMPSDDPDHVSSKGRAKSLAESALSSFYQDVTWYKLNEAIDEAVNGVEKFCELNLNSIYHRECNNITQALEKCVLRFQQLGISISGIQEVQVEPSIPYDFSSSLKSLLRESTKRRSLSDYIERATPLDYIEYKYSLLGDRTITTYSYPLRDIANRIIDDITDALRKNSERGNRKINNIWQDFRKKLEPEVANRKAIIKQRVNAYKSTLTQSSSASVEQSVALAYLRELEKEATE